jgi:hypothetical protein
VVRVDVRKMSNDELDQYLLDNWDNLDQYSKNILSHLGLRKKGGDE